MVVLKIYQHLMQNTTMDVTSSTYQKNAQNQDLNRSTILLFNSSQIIEIPLLEEGRALEIPQLLKTYIVICKKTPMKTLIRIQDKNKKKRLLQHYGSSIIVTNSINTT